MIFIISYLSMMSFWLGITLSNVVLYGRMFRTALISLLITWIFSSGPFYGLFLSLILTTVITDSIISGRSVVLAIFTASSRYYWYRLSISLQLNYETSLSGIGVRGLWPEIQILLKFQMLRTRHLFSLQMWLILRTSLLFS
jgi:hypothetical protein